MKEKFASCNLLTFYYPKIFMNNQSNKVIDILILTFTPCMLDVILAGGSDGHASFFCRGRRASR